MNRLKIAVIFLCLVFWPLSLFLSSPSLNLNFKKLRDQTIFYYDPQAQQQVIMKGYLYPTIWMSRLFQNKPSIYLERFEFNFFALTDLNNYFFAFHPREIIIDNTNLQKYPFLSIAFFLIGLYKLPKHKYFNPVGLSLVLMIIILSLLKNFDGYDFVLYFPLSAILLIGFMEFYKKPSYLKTIFVIFFLTFTIIELTHTLIAYLK